MGSINRSSRAYGSSEKWYLRAALILLCTFVGFAVYDSMMATAADHFQRLLTISPLLILIAVHWLSSSGQSDDYSDSCGVGSGSGGSPWGIALVLLLLFFIISAQPWGSAFFLCVAFYFLFFFFSPIFGLNGASSSADY